MNSTVSHTVSVHLKVKLSCGHTKLAVGSIRPMPGDKVRCHKCEKVNRDAKKLYKQLQEYK